MSDRRNTLGKAERLKRNSHIQRLFTSGKSFVKYPFRVSYLLLDEPTVPPCQFLVSVSKKRFKRANKRNLLKRRTREAYRLNKHDFTAQATENQQHVLVAFIYIPHEELPFGQIQKGMRKALEHLMLLTQKKDEK